jgi:hypothetical protein
VISKALVAHFQAKYSNLSDQRAQRITTAPGLQVDDLAIDDTAAATGVREVIAAPAGGAGAA